VLDELSRLYLELEQPPEFAVFHALEDARADLEHERFSRC